MLGGGAAGAAVAARFSRQLAAGDVAVVEGERVSEKAAAAAALDDNRLQSCKLQKHYCQPTYTLLGAGLIPADHVGRRASARRRVCSQLVSGRSLFSARNDGRFAAQRQTLRLACRTTAASQKFASFEVCILATSTALAAENERVLRVLSAINCDFQRRDRTQL